MYHVSFPGLGIEDLEISRVAFSIGNFNFYWYGLLITIAVLLTMFLASRSAPKYGLKSDDIFDFFLAMIPAMIVFARLYYVVFSWEDFKDRPLAIFDTRSGGLAFYGGVIGGALAFWIVAKVKKIPFHRVLDFLVPYVALGQAIGRWGNFFNQEAFGTNTDLPWGMISEGTVRYLQYSQIPGVDPMAPVHPTFFYEFVGNLIIFAILIALRKRRKFPYQVMAAYLFLYGILRFFVEGIRTDSLYIGQTGIRVSQLLSLLMVLAAAIFAIAVRARHRRKLRAYREGILRGDLPADATPPEPASLLVSEEEAAALAAGHDPAASETDEKGADYVDKDPDDVKDRDVSDEEDVDGKIPPAPPASPSLPEGAEGQTLRERLDEARRAAEAEDTSAPPPEATRSGDKD